ncbi:UNVERIFIED_CONTAM: hypothetical protein GTU68_049878 [Idotea baltica]|nr:hypothetical protein [Idotea baltica]
MAATGVRVAIAEDTHWGGTCVNVGCVPKKLFVFASHYSHEVEDAEAYGWDIETKGFDWSRLIANKNKEIKRLNDIYIRLLENAGVELINGYAKISAAHEVSVDGKTYTAERILVAVGGKPFIPEFRGSDLVIDSNDAFYLDELPSQICIVGGGYIACEFACIFKGLGVEVHLIYRGEEVLRGFEDDLRGRIRTEMSKQGIQVHLKEDVSEITESNGNRRNVALKSGQSLEVDQVFYATGRIPRTEGLWADDLAIDTDAKGQIKVNSNYQSSVPSIYALGDVVGYMALTPVATAEAMALLKHIETGEDVDFDYNNIPSAVFTTPNLATVGLTEAQVMEQGIAYQVFEADFRHLKHTLTGRDERVYMKLIVRKDNDKVIGVHMMGPEAGEVIQLAGVAIKSGATKAHFDQTIGIHPTMAEEFVTLRTPRAD